MDTLSRLARLVGLLLAIAALTAGAVPGAARAPARAADANLLADPDFEASPYSAYYTYGSGTFTWTVDQSQSPTHSLKIVSAQPAGQFARWLSNTKSIAAKPGVKYSAAVSLRTSNVTQQANLSLNFWDASGGYLGQTFDSQPVSGTAAWQPVSLQATAPAAAAFVRVEFRLWGPGTVWFDDASLVTPTAGGKPVNLTLPVVTYSEPTFPNYVFSVTQGTWANSPISFSYKWYRGDNESGPFVGPVVGTGPTLTLQWPASGNGFVSVEVTATSAAGSGTAQAYVAFAPTEFTVVEPPRIVVQGGGSPRAGATLDATMGLYLGTGTSISSAYSKGFRDVWLRCDASGENCVSVDEGPKNFSGDFHVVTAADVTFTLRVLVWNETLPGVSRRVVVASAPTAVIAP